MNVGSIALTCFWLLLGQAPVDDIFYTRDRNHRIPVNFDRASRAEFSEIRLYVSPDQGRSYQLAGVLDRPEQDSFTYYAPGDGTYWLQVATVNKQGQQTPSNVATTKPAQKMVIDTAKPIVHTLNAKRDGDEILVNWQLQEEFPDWASFRLEQQPRGSGAIWTPIAAQAAFAGQTVFRVNTPQPITIRLSLRDLAGNQSYAQAEVAGLGSFAVSAPVVGAPPIPGAGAGLNEMRPIVSGSSPQGPGVPLPILAAEVAIPHSPPSSIIAAAPPPPVDMNVQTVSKIAPPTVPVIAPPIQPEIKATPPPPKDERVIGDSRWVANPQSPGQTSSPATPEAVPSPGPLASNPLPSRPLPPLQYVNHPEVTLEFEVSRMGPSGLGRVELHGTVNDGLNWKLIAYDKAPQESGTGNRQKRTLMLGGKKGAQEGIYGFTIVLKNKIGMGKAPPKEGDTPEIRIELDTTPPVAELINPIPDPQRPTEAVLLRWTAHDKNLEKNPITLEWGERTEGPWHLIAQDVPNLGRFSWQPTKDIPLKVFLRIRVRDLAGNESIATSREPEAIDPIDLSEPEGHLVGVVTPARRN